MDNPNNIPRTDTKWHTGLNNPKALNDDAKLLGRYSPWAIAMYKRGRHAQEELCLEKKGVEENRLQRLFTKTNQGILGGISKLYGVSPERASQLFHESLRDANGLITLTLRDSLPSKWADFFGLRNEVYRFSNYPADQIWRLAHNARDQIERYQIYRQFWLANMFLELNSSYPTEKIHQQIYRLHELLNRELYDSPNSNGNQEISIISWHGENNEFTGFDPLPGSFEREMTYSVRQLRNGGEGIYVLTNDRIKDNASAGAKAFLKAAQNQQSINVHIHVNDLAGVRFTVMGDKRQRDYLYEKISIILIKEMDKGGVKSSLISRVIPDIAVDGRSTNGAIDWKRVKVYLNDEDGIEISQPIELIIDDIEVFLNGQFYVGPNISPRMPRAHRLYEVLRAQEIFPLLFPEEVYKGAYNKIDIQKEMKNHLSATVTSIRWSM